MIAYKKNNNENVKSVNQIISIYNCQFYKHEFTNETQF